MSEPSFDVRVARAKQFWLVYTFTAFSRIRINREKRGLAWEKKNTPSGDASTCRGCNSHP